MSAGNFKAQIPADPVHMLQVSSLHIGIVRDLKDPEGRGRVKVECPSLNYEGKENWLNWCEVISMPVSTVYAKGDFGQWWPLVPGQSVYITFKSGDYLQPCCFPGPAWSEEPEKIGAEYIPSEAKVIVDKDLRKGTRIRVIKSEAGHSIVMDDNGKQETMHIVDWTGSGFFWATTGTQEDDKENKGDESRWRKGKRRGSKNAMAQTCSSPSELAENGTVVTGFLDVNGQGWISVAKDGKGIFSMFAGGSPGECDPSIILHSEDQAIYLTAGDCQEQIRGKENAIYVTKQMIYDCMKEDPKQFFEPLIEMVKDKFSKFDGGGDSGDSGSANLQDVYITTA